MRVYFTATLVLLLCLATTACSYRVEFFVLNNSDESIEIEYMVDAVNACEREVGPQCVSNPLSRSFAPAVTDVAKWIKSGGDANWRTADETHTLSGKSVIIRTRLAPGQVMMIAETRPPAVDPDTSGEFELQGVIIKGSNGRIELQGGQVASGFKEKTYTQRFIDYR